MKLSTPKLQGWLADYIRVLRMARKPTREEFKMVAKVSLVGIAIIGFIGFLIYLLMVELPKMLG